MVDRTALEVLDAYAARFAAAYPGDAVSDTVAEVRTTIRASLESTPPPAPVATSVEVTPDRRPPAGRGLIGAGAGLIGLGVASLGVMSAGMAFASKATDDLLASEPGDRTDAFHDGKIGNTLTVVGGAAAGAFLATGIGLLTAGLVKKKRGARRQATLAPAWLAGGAGLVLKGWM